MRWQERIDKCVVCGNDLPKWHRSDKVTCSNKCRQKAHRDRIANSRESVIEAARVKRSKALERRVLKGSKKRRPEKVLPRRVTGSRSSTCNVGLPA